MYRQNGQSVKNTPRPFDLDAVVPELMTVQERALLNNYHTQVYKKISPYLEEEEKEWLKEATREI